MFLKSNSKNWQTKLTLWGLVANLVLQPIFSSTVLAEQSQVEVDKTQGKNPNLVQASNGTLIVDINSPNMQGLSHNQYKNLQVGSAGLIFNNSVNNSNTQLAGYINGNPNVRGLPAQIILNEVTGSLPSQLNGYMEIAGNKAELIIANPNGIVGNNFGFINTTRGVLTTGRPELDNRGALAGFKVTQGEIKIEGAGLNAKTTKRVDLIAEAVKINAGLWADEVRVTTGQNQVQYQQGTASKLQQTPTTGVSLDVAALGGMYANRIILVGTKDGVGVNNAGNIAAQQELTITQEGKLILQGNTHSAGKITLQSAQDIENQGDTVAQGALQIKSGTHLKQTGNIYSGAKAELYGQEKITNSGKIISETTLAVQAKETLNEQGLLYAKESLQLKGGKLTGQGEVFAGENLDLNFNQDFTNTNILKANNNINLASSAKFINENELLAGAQLNFATQEIENKENAKISAQQIKITNSGKIENLGLLSATKIHIVSQQLDNKNTGKIYADEIALAGGEINNYAEGAVAPVIAARQNLNIGVEKLSNREHGLILS